MDIPFQVRSALNGLPMPLWCASPGGEFFFFNTSLLQYIGLPSGVAAADVWLDAIHAADRQRFSHEFSSIRNTDIDGLCELKVRGEDGKFRRFLVRITSIAGESGELAYWQGSCEDIEEVPPLPEGNATGATDSVIRTPKQKQAGEALAASEQLARSHVEALKQTMVALSNESDPERLVEHIVRTIVRQFDAHSISAWRKDFSTDFIGFEFAFEDDRIIKKSDPRFAGMNLWLPMDAKRTWPEKFKANKPDLMEDIRLVPAYALSDRLIQMGIVTVLLIPMSISGRLEGAIAIRFAQRRVLSADEIELAQALANHAMLAIQLNSLSERDRQAAVITERNRMARDIHDTLAQGFTGVIVQLEAAKDATQQGYTEEAERHLDLAGSLARDSLAEARRSVQALRPRFLDRSDWFLALQSQLSKITFGTNLKTEFRLTGHAQRLPQGWDEHLVRIGQEALTNTIQHAGASLFSTFITYTTDMLKMELRDNGLGFNPNVRHAGFGLQSMQERSECIGGIFSITSTAGAGTSISVEISLPGRYASTMKTADT